MRLRAVGPVAVVVGFLALIAVSCTAASPASAPAVSAPPPATTPVVTDRPPFDRDLTAYAGLGAWVDVYDYAPAYQPPGTDPAITVADLDDMARRGVKTVFIQAARWDDSSPNGIVDYRLLGAFLGHAHQLGLRVVGWYLPDFTDVDADVARAMQIHDFHSGVDRFDGLAIDIEYTQGEPDPDRRNDALVRFSQALRSKVTDEPIAAVVLTAVHLEVINTNFWPDFPYAAIRDQFDVWMPMAYWTMRSDPYRDGYKYAKESVDRLRNDLGKPDALVAPIGGISDEMTGVQISDFASALRDMSAIGGSFYDWNTMDSEKQALVTELFTKGPASALPKPPSR